MIRRFRLVACVSVLALPALAACEPVPDRDVVATVNGTKITESQLQHFVDRFATSDSPTASQVREYLRVLIQVTALGGDDQTAGDTSQAVAQAAVDGVSPASAEETRAHYELGFTASQIICLGAIATADAAAAEEAIEAINGGMSFADAVAEYSIDDALTAAGGIVKDGDSECIDAARVNDTVQATLADAAVGEAAGPLDLNGQAVVLIQRPFADLDQATRDGFARTLAASKLLDDLDVQVNPGYGRWDGDSDRIVPLG